MSYYMIQAAYTPQAWGAMIKKPEDRSKAIGALAKKLGGKLVSLYHSFGDYDVVVIIDVPGNVNAAAMSLAAYSGGHLKSLVTTPLMTVSETVSAARKAGGVRFATPGKKGK
jgi:uncharacterized protein with GYD domain